MAAVTSWSFELGGLELKEGCETEEDGTPGIYESMRRGRRRKAESREILLLLVDRFIV